jgi:hypothetical protein
MIHNYKAPTKWGPVISKVIDVLVYSIASFLTIVCMWRSEWAEGTFWAAFYCMWKLTDIKEILDDRL